VIMPNFEQFAERMVKTEKWIYEGESTDGTALVSCPRCGCVVPEYLQLKHAYWHGASCGEA